MRQSVQTDDDGAEEQACQEDVGAVSEDSSMVAPDERDA